MKGFYTYLYIQVRRILKLLPTLMTTTLLVCGCVGIFAVLYLNSSEMTENSRKYRIAVVGNTSDSYLGFGISVLSVMDDSRFMLEFPTMTEGEARRALLAGEITAYAKIPEGLVDSIVHGRNDKLITFGGGTGQNGIAGILVGELAEVVSTLIVRSQSAIYGMQNLLRENGMGDILWEATESLNLRFIDIVLNRTKLCGVEILGMANSLSTEGYYFCSMVVLFFLFSGINSSPLFGRRNPELMRLMASRGVGAVRQVAGEYLAYFLLEICCFAGVFLALGLVLGSGTFQIAEWKNMDARDMISFFAGLFPVMAALSAMQFLMYELVDGIVGSVLLQFLCGISMAYLSGCFYPASVFPDTLRRLGESLPVGLALRYADNRLTGGSSLVVGLGLVLYLAIFLTLTALARSRRLQRG